ncbi:MAG: ammonium transporter [Fimbriiglobus sp.]
MTFRRGMMAALFAVGVLVFANMGRTQEKEKEKGKEATTSKVDDAKDKLITDLKKTVDELKSQTESLKKDLTKTTSEATKAIGMAGETAKSVEAMKAASTATPKMDDITKAMTTAKTDAEAMKKDIDEKLKGLSGLSDIGSKADKALAKSADGDISKGDTAWMLVSSAFVMLMVPGLALFYGGMVRRKNILATMMQSMAMLCIIGVFWVAVGYGLAFGPSAFKLTALGVDQGGLIGWSWDLFFLKGIAHTDVLPGYHIPVYVHVMFQGMFAIITPALISGAIAERIRFWPFVIFTILWISFVYCPLAHMVWAFDWFDPAAALANRGKLPIGFLGKMGALDFAGGTVVHIAAGFAGLAACLVLRRRDGYGKSVFHPNSMVITLLGAGLLWMGWFGFNGGSASISGAQASSAFAATQAAAAAAGLSWIIVEWILKGKPTALGLASGIVAGLVAVTPASGYIYVWGGVAIGAAAGVVCYLAVALKNMLGYDDSLDAFGVHGVGGFLGAVLTGLFCYTDVAGANGYFAMKTHAARIETLKSSELATALKTKTDEFETAKKDFAAKSKDLKEDSDEYKTFKAELDNFEALATDASAAVENGKKELETLQALVAKEEKDGKGPFSQTMIQIKAAGISAVLATVISVVLVLLTQLLTFGNFTTSKKEETTGLDQTEHGEAGFDFGYAGETLVGSSEPKAASMPKSKFQRFDLVVEGVPAEDIVKIWSSLCQPSDKAAPADFLAVYPSVTTFSGNKFRCRGADAPAVASRLESLFKKLIPGKPIKVVRL